MAFTTLITVVIHRYGLVAAASLLFVDNIVADTLHHDLSVWWSTPTVLTLSLLLGLVGFASPPGRRTAVGQVVPD